MTSPIQRLFRYFGYEVHRAGTRQGNSHPAPPLRTSSLDPVWPLPRDPAGPSPDEIRAAFAKFPSWHYAYEFSGGLSFPRRYGDGAVPEDPRRQLQRFRHFMPYLLDSQGGSLKGKRVLDIACNSGYWSLQCALLGADVVGFDARPELIEQANLVRRIVGLSNVEYRLLDFWEMTPAALGGTFDIVLNLGILYHLAWPEPALRLTKSMSRGTILLDTQLVPWSDPVVRLEWEGSDRIQNAQQASIVAKPSASAVELILNRIGCSDYFAIPLHSPDMPQDYRDLARGSWLIRA